MNTPFRKVVEDLFDNLTKTVMAVLSIALGVFSLGVIMDANAVLEREMATSYEQIRPASFVLCVDNPDDELLSLLRNKTIIDRLVMTGELSLTGQVLPIGGLKEKTVAARRNKARHIIIPRQNERDLDEIPANVKKGIEFHPVDRFEDVLALALPD